MVLIAKKCQMWNVFVFMACFLNTYIKECTKHVETIKHFICKVFLTGFSNKRERKSHLAANTPVVMMRGENNNYTQL